MLNNKKDIKDWLDGYEIKKYQINDDMTVNVNGNVQLSYYNLIAIQINFNIVNGFFDLECNNLTTLKGCPMKVNGDFDCSWNKLTTLKDIKHIDVKGDLFYDCNPYTSFTDWPKRIECWEEIQKHLTKEQQRELIVKEPEWVPIVYMI